MPGVCLDVRSEGAVSHSLDSLFHLDSYAADTVDAHRSAFLGYTSHPGYPVEVVDTDDVAVYLEGCLYGVDEVRETMRSLAADLFDPTADAVSRFVDGTDGEFLLVGVDKRDGRVAAVTDAFGRLPVYCDESGPGVALAREPRFLLDRREGDGFDRMGLAQYLLFGYTLGTRTLWDGVERLPAGTHLVVDSDGDVSRARHYEFDFGGKRHADKSAEKNARTLASLFTRACDRRTSSDRQTILSLSGGLDSRAVAGALRAFDRPFAAATFEEADGSADADVEIAGRVADAGGFDRRTYSLGPLDDDDVDRLLGMKEGLNPLHLASILEFFERLVDDYGHRSTYLTGDGGDKALPDLTPDVAVDSMAEFVSYACSKNAVFPPETVAELTGVDERSLREEIASVVSTYPETSWDDLYVHFLVAERGRNWLFEGEDRNRGYFWSTTPFYDRRFFEYAMNVPASQKSGYRLYRRFLDELWPAAAGIEHADFGVAPDSPLYGIIQRGLGAVDGHPRLERVVHALNDLRSGGGAARDVGDRVSEQASRADTVGRYFDRSVLDRVASEDASYGSKQMYTLFTLTSELSRSAETNPTPTAR